MLILRRKSQRMTRFPLAAGTGSTCERPQFKRKIRIFSVRLIPDYLRVCR